MITDKIAVCALIYNPDGKILAVSRKDDPNDFGLPGGKVEPGESMLEAIIRELEQETGYSEPLDFIEIYRGQSDHTGYSTTTYLCVSTLNPEIILKTTESGVIAWVTWDKLKSGSFGRYNAKLERLVTIYKNQTPLTIKSYT